MGIFDGSVSPGTLALLGICLFIALAFEFVNGFHDTANAVATVIYTKSLKPGVAVAWSGLLNFLGVFFGVVVGGAGVAYGIVHLLPVDLLLNIGASAGILMVLSLLLSAIIWNFGTWYFGLPSSSSHALVGSILGVGLASSIFSGNGFGSGVNWDKAKDIGLALLISPLVGFILAALVFLLCKALIKNPALYQEPKGDEPPPLWIRALLCLTCTGVSFAHGSNDGQKGVGLVMLILIGILPAQYALNDKLAGTETTKIVATLQQTETVLKARASDAETQAAVEALAKAEAALTATPDYKALSGKERTILRQTIMKADSAIGKLEKKKDNGLTAEEAKAVGDAKKGLRSIVDFVVNWVVIAVALALGVGTTIGWKRIVVTVGEKIGKTHLTYAQGAAAELVAMVTIFTADLAHLPVSTTHVLSSGIAGTMAANRAGLQKATIRNIMLAWVLTLPVTMLLSGILFTLTAGQVMKNVKPEAVKVAPRPERNVPDKN